MRGCALIDRGSVRLHPFVREVSRLVTVKPPPVHDLIYSDAGTPAWGLGTAAMFPEKGTRKIRAVGYTSLFSQI